MFNAIRRIKHKFLVGDLPPSFELSSGNRKDVEK